MWDRTAVLALCVRRGHSSLVVSTWTSVQHGRDVGALDNHPEACKGVSPERRPPLLLARVTSTCKRATIDYGANSVGHPLTRSDGADSRRAALPRIPVGQPDPCFAR